MANAHPEGEVPEHFPGSYDRAKAPFPAAFGAAGWNQLEGQKILGLTVQNPWGWGLAKKLKPLENRTWAPPRCCIGRYIAIHAGKTFDRAGLETFRELLDHPLVKPKLAELLGEHGELTPEAMPMGCVLSVGRLVRVVEDPWELTEEQRVWWAGQQFGWLFEDMVELPIPVPCRGAQKLWALPREVLELVRQRYVAARAARKP